MGGSNPWPPTNNICIPTILPGFAKITQIRSDLFKGSSDWSPQTDTSPNPSPTDPAQSTINNPLSWLVDRGLWSQDETGDRKILPCRGQGREKKAVDSGRWCGHRRAVVARGGWDGAERFGECKGCNNRGNDQGKTEGYWSRVCKRKNAGYSGSLVRFEDGH